MPQRMARRSQVEHSDADPVTPVIGGTPSPWMVVVSASLWISIGLVVVLMGHVFSRLPEGIPRPITQAGAGGGGAP
jgi:hypothetical protein